MPKEHQTPIDIEAQIKNLELLNCTIDDYEETRTFLNDVSYFRLVKGYCFGLKSKNSNFNDGVSFNQIKGLYLFNAKFISFFRKSKKQKLIYDADLQIIFPANTVHWVTKRVTISKTKNIILYFCKKLNVKYPETADLQSLKIIATIISAAIYLSML